MYPASVLVISTSTSVCTKNTQSIKLELDFQGISKILMSFSEWPIPSFELDDSGREWLNEFVDPRGWNSFSQIDNYIQMSDCIVIDSSAQIAYLALQTIAPPGRENGHSSVSTKGRTA